MKLRKIILPKLLVICSTIMSACSFISFQSNLEDKEFPVYLDPSYYFEIHYLDARYKFPFEEGSLIELEGMLIYHRINDWVKTEILPQAQWFASFYPWGKIVSAETLSVQMRDINNPEIIFEFDWLVDHKTMLLIVSDRQAPPGLFVSPDSGDTTHVCLTLKIEEINRSEEGNGQFLVIYLKPVGDEVGGLIRSEIRKCNQ